MAVRRTPRSAADWRRFDGNAFARWWPGVTAGNGQMKQNNANPGEEQPRGTLGPSPRRKIGCKQCGFPADLSRHSNHGGNLNAQGGGGAVTRVEDGRGLKAGNQEYRDGSSCPLCFSPNYARA